MHAAPLPFCLPVEWTAPATGHLWHAWPRLDPRGYHVVNISRGAQGDVSEDHIATVDDFGDLVRVLRPSLGWINTIGQRGAQ